MIKRHFDLIACHGTGSIAKYLVGKRLVRRQGCSGDGKRLEHLAIQIKLKTRWAHISARHSQIDFTWPVGFGVFEGKTLRYCTVTINDVTIVGPSSIDDIVSINIINLVIQKFIHHRSLSSGWLGIGCQSFTRTQAGGNESIRKVIVSIGMMY